ncbi:MAG: putative selenium-dependent hydroxylase accessory protein YqeC [Eubacterium sp.]|nr:putative selenium-dependent hydroxylase accessory protein YqeC [Eubacterium sp.]
MFLRKISNEKYHEYNNITDALFLGHLPKKSPYLVAIIGAGGKTTTLLNLSKELSVAGKKVLATTTTHMQAPKEWNIILSNDEKEIIKRAKETHLVIAGTPGDRRGMKLMSENVFKNVLPNFDFCIYEADGSRRHPIKTPAAYEPVILPNTDLLIVCTGVSAIGDTIENACHRYELSSYQRDEIITPQIAADIIKKGYGNYSIPTVFLFNQADSKADTKNAMLAAESFESVIISSYELRSGA